MNTEHDTSIRTDALWQQAVVSRFGWCERCHTTEGLCGHHFIARRYKRSRLDIRNGICLCVHCHQWAHKYTLRSIRFGLITLVYRGDFKNLNDVFKYKKIVKYRGSL